MIFDDYIAAEKLLESTIRTMDHSFMDGTDANEFFFERSQRFHDLLGNPERDFEYVHIAGTSGKGSTAVMIYEMLAAAGWNVGLKISPHVTTTLERMHVRGQLIDPQHFIDAVHEVVPVAQKLIDEGSKWAPSYSEIFFGVALVAFQKAGCEWIVLETSCGGRYDLTNVIPAPRVVALTNIGLDHTAILGDTLPEIAWHKAGIIKNGSAVYSTEKNPDVRAVFDAEAAEHGGIAQYVQPSHEYTLRMPGTHQQWNAALATAVCTELDVAEKDIAAGLVHAQLPARMETLQESPHVIIDGAHSEPKMRALAEALESLKPWKRLHLIFTCKEGRDPAEILGPIAPLADTLTITSFTLPGFSSVDAQDIANAASQLRTDLAQTIEPDAKAALDAVLKTAGPEDLVLITGSLYFVGTIRERWYPIADIVQHQSLM